MNGEPAIGRQYMYQRQSTIARQVLPLEVRLLGRSGQGVTSVRKLPNTHVIHTTGAIEARLVARIAVCDGFITTINLDINAHLELRFCV